MSTLDKIHSAIGRMENWLVNIAAASLFLIMLVVVLDVIMRYGFNSPLSWSYELIAMYLMVIVFFFALSNTLEDNAHIAVDILHIKMQPRARHGCLAVGYWLSLCVFILILWTAAQETWISYINREVTDGLIQWPTWLSWLSVPVGIALLILRIAFRAVGHTLSGLSGRSVIDLPLVSGHEKE
jgi:TRAP-type C4-dicarboxylate transport system permease small subunit